MDEEGNRRNKVRRIVSIEDQKGLIEAGLIESALVNPEGPTDPFVGGIRATKIITNCPVIAHPITPNECCRSDTEAS